MYQNDIGLASIERITAARMTAACIGGEGEVVELTTGRTFPIGPGTVYALDKNDAHILRATRGDLKLVCVFFPALTGTETHRPDGSYAPAES
jgi:L-ectoine synthase